PIFLSPKAQPSTVGLLCFLPILHPLTHSLPISPTLLFTVVTLLPFLPALSLYSSLTEQRPLFYSGVAGDTIYFCINYNIVKCTTVVALFMTEK
ncbi:MAG: hypothetical protein WCK85_12145, partial [Chlorobium sp.]